MITLIISVSDPTRLHRISAVEDVRQRFLSIVSFQNLLKKSNYFL